VKRTLGGMLIFGMMVVILLGALQLFNWVPSALQEGALQRYTSVDEVREHLRIGTIYLPAYYPRTVQWPPVLVAGQARPYKAVITEFARSGAPEETILVISQTELPHPPLTDTIRLATVRETVRYQLKGRAAVLEVGLCRRDEQCCRVTWEEGAFRLSLSMRSSPVELERIAESMIMAPADRPDGIRTNTR
jgi:hypothetical protein